jgi:hypothetical protein
MVDTVHLQRESTEHLDPRSTTVAAEQPLRVAPGHGCVLVTGDLAPA